MAKDALVPRVRGLEKPSILVVARRVLDGGTRLLLGVTIALQVTERLVLAGGAIVTYRQGFAAATPIAIALAVLTSVRSSLRLAVGVRVRKRVATETARALLGRNLLAPCALEEEGGESVVAQEMLDLERLLSDAGTGLIADSLASAGVAIVAAAFLPARLVASSAAGILLVALVSEVTRRRAGRAMTAGWDAFAPVLEGLAGCVAGAAEIVGNGKTNEHQQAIEEASSHWASAMLRGDVAAALVGRIPALVALLVAGLALYLDETSRGIAPAIAIGHAFVVAALLPAFVGVARSILEIMRAESRTRNLEALLCDPIQAPEGTSPPDLPATIEWRDVAYAYPTTDPRDRRLALSQVTVTWSIGSPLALAGPNGAGKSTLLRLLLAFDVPSMGEITIGGASLRTLDLPAFRSKIAFVSQRPYFPRGATIRQSIKLFAPRAPDTALLDALERVDILERLSRRGTPPLDVEVTKLSAGERQRVALARALSQDAPIVLLDEPDANLDAAGTAMLEALLIELARTRMVAFVAHDPRVLRAGGKIVRLDGNGHSIVVPIAQLAGDES